MCSWCGAKGRSLCRSYDKSDDYPRGRKSSEGKESACAFAEYGHGCLVECFGFGTHSEFKMAKMVQEYEGVIFNLFEIMGG